MRYSFRSKKGNKSLLILLSLIIALSIFCAKPSDIPPPEFTKEFSPPTGRALELEDYYRVKSIGGIRLSPNGRWIAFTISERNESDNGNTSDSWLVGTGGNDPARRIEKEGTRATNPGWIENGLLRYTSGGSTWLLNVEDPNARPVKETDRPSRGNISPDGKWTASTRQIPYEEEEAVIVSDFEHRHDERFKGAIFDWMYFQRDGRSLPVNDPRKVSSSEIIITPADGGEPVQLTDLGLRPGGMVWNPESTEILFTADSHFRDEMTYGRSDLWTATVSGRVTRLTDDGYNYRNTAYSPDGKYISYVRSMGTDMIIERKMDHGGSSDLFLMTVAGKEMINLTADWDLDPGSPRWSPDGEHIYFTAGIGGCTHLFRVPVSGGDVEQITTGQRRIGSLSFDENYRTIVYTVGLIHKPTEIFAADIDGSNERQLTNAHDEFISEITFSKAERLLYNSYDGTVIEGWLLYPYGYSPENGPYPLIVNSHGGPHSASGYSFNFKQQYFAAQGYFVLQTNFRSSTGYGDDFKWATWGAWGDKDGEDVMSGVDFVIDHFPIDADRVGTTGHSYGGFMTNWLITQYPDRFAAAVCGAGISNWISDYGTADIARTKETEFYGTPWEEESRNRMIRQSPLTYAGNVKTPTLFIHGEVDQRVPYEEAEQMYFAIKKNGVPAKVIQYEGQSHGISGHWNNVHRMISEL
ncbi:S9 family peptidase, partial [candidate division KSB1 bacterium]